VNAFIPALANMLAMHVMCGLTGFLLCQNQGREWRARARFFAGEYTNRNGDTFDIRNTLSGISCLCKLRVESGRLHHRERPAVGRASGRAAFQTLSQQREGALSPQRFLKGEKAHRNGNNAASPGISLLAKRSLKRSLKQKEPTVISRKPLILLASPRRFERPTPSLGGKCSILLSYGDRNKRRAFITELHLCFNPFGLRAQKLSSEKTLPAGSF
jgi:hypothetical protein